jgi:hypothetical protein
MPDKFHAHFDGYSYELIVGEQEACVIQLSTDGSYEARWFGSITDAMSWWRELNDPSP